jgi:hypothetical protein
MKLDPIILIVTEIHRVENRQKGTQMRAGTTKRT